MNMSKIPCDCLNPKDEFQQYDIMWKTFFDLENVLNQIYSVKNPLKKSKQ